MSENNTQTFTQAQWLRAAAQQPPMPQDLPGWIVDFVKDCREGDIHEYLNDSARIVPKQGPGGQPPRYSAVLILLGDLAEGGADEAGVASHKKASMLLTHRAPTMRKHSGQVAFPGGGREDQDAGPIETALREANEETGLDPASVDVCAVMQPIYIDRSNFAVIPVLAYWREPHPVYCASAENDWVQPYPVAKLVDPARRFRVEYLGWSGPAWMIDDMVLWGFTGGVISAILQRAGWEEPWDDAAAMDLFATLQESSNGEALGEMRQAFTHAGPDGGAP
ncbi:MAG TPA: CoA pyrophosphatase [Candidatus Corynebacterium gallistercoris]|uniref:CoA pyrophosphatase n=1 Tax=Candidatus Corynebacterium gallistercoris TaxID=2838530 RepID=A0A9D1S0B5_9CORY|nr:CoA pyrophosphatase [Candidatus Corynebacterium gallistercoris]